MALNRLKRPGKLPFSTPVNACKSKHRTSPLFWDNMGKFGYQWDYFGKTRPGAIHSWVGEPKLAAAPDWPAKAGGAMSQIDSAPEMFPSMIDASRPVSRVLYGPRGCPHGRGGHSSGTSVAGCLGATHPDDWPGNRLAGCPAASSLFGLAPDGVYRAAAVAGARGGLLPHRFTLAAARRGGFFSVALSLRYGENAFLAGCYPASCFHGARTFLRRRLSAIASAATRPAGTPHLRIALATVKKRGKRRNFGAISSMVNRRLARWR